MPKRKQVQSGKSPFSLRLASLRKEQGLNMETLAQHVNVSKSYISLLESGGRQPSREVVLKLATALSPETADALRDELLVLAGFVPVNTWAMTAYRDALQSYELALLHDPDNFKIFSRLIIALIKSGRIAQAQERIQSGLQHFHESVQMQFLLAFLELSKGNYAVSVLNMENALRQYELLQDKGNLRRWDLVFNMGSIYFLNGHALLGDYVQSEAESAKQEALDVLEKGRRCFEEALAEMPDDVYMLDEYARLLFNRAYLRKESEAWQLTIQAYRRLLVSPLKHELGSQPLMESAAFLAHAYTQNQDYDGAELTLGLLSAFSPDYWLVHYLQACLHSCRFATLGHPSELDLALAALARALAADNSGQAEAEARQDPDLSPLRRQRPAAWEALFNQERTPS